MSRRLVFLLSVLSVLYVAALRGFGGPGRARSHRSRQRSAPAPRLNLPPIQKRTLSNGLPCGWSKSHEVPLVQINLLVKAGSGDDPAGKFGSPA